MARVVLANRWTAPDGKQHKGGQTVEVSDGVARELIARGKARAAESKPQAQPAVKPKEGKSNG